jgi:hypothetical protein
VEESDGGGDLAIGRTSQLCCLHGIMLLYSTDRETLIRQIVDS